MSENPVNLTQNPEMPKNYRSFTEIQNEMVDLVKNPNPQKERGLRIERARVINEARSIGVDYGILGSIKRRMLDIETHNPSILISAQLINEINTDRLEEEAMAIHGWDDRFAGLIEEYKQGAIRNLSLAFLKKKGAPQSDIDSLEREIDVLNWGGAPSIINTMPIEPEIQPTQPLLDENNIELFTDMLARKTAREQGLLSPYAYMLEAVDGEEFLKTAQRIVPGQEPRFWAMLDDKEKDEWMVRSSIWIIAVKKSQSFASEELMMDKMHDLAVDMNKWSHQVLWGQVEDGEIIKEGKAGVLPATGIYTHIISDERFRDWMGEYDQIDSRGVMHPGLYEADGSPSDFNLKTVFFNGYYNIEPGLRADYGAQGVSKLRDQAQFLVEACPDSFYPHDKSWGKSIDAEGFKAIRASLRFWLTTQGRDLLLSKDELDNRMEFFADKERALAIIEFRAREAEIIAWNYVYSLGMLETFDSRAFRPEGTKRHGPSSFWSLSLWTCMHLQERFEQKVLRKDDYDNPEGKEEWAGNLGTWALNNYDKGSWTTHSGGKTVVSIPRILPDVIFRGAMFNNYVYQSGRGNDGVPLTDKDGSAMFGPLNKIGREVLANPAGKSRFEIAAEINWNKMSDTPYVSYVWDELRWANIIEKCFKKGEASEVNLKDFGEAVRNLRFSREVREKLLMIYDGLDVNSPRLQPKEGLLVWKTLTLKSHKEYFPNLFLEN